MGDLTFGLRLLRNQPAYAALTIVTIAIGIVVSTTLFSVAHGVLQTPLPFADAERLLKSPSCAVAGRPAFQPPS